MKIVVLAGGLSTERDVSLTSGAGICRTLLENGHQAVLMDAFMGIPYDADKLEDLFSLPDAGLSIASGISADEPDLAAIRASRMSAWPKCNCPLPDGRHCIYGTSRRYWRKRKTPGYFRCTGNQIYRSELSRQRSGNGQRADKTNFPHRRRTDAKGNMALQILPGHFAYCSWSFTPSRCKTMLRRFQRWCIYRTHRRRI